MTDSVKPKGPDDRVGVISWAYQVKDYSPSIAIDRKYTTQQHSANYRAYETSLTAYEARVKELEAQEKERDKIFKELWRVALKIEGDVNYKYAETIHVLTAKALRGGDEKH